MPIKRPKWEEIDAHERGWSMQDKESYERSCAENDAYYARLKDSMQKEDFLRLLKDLDLEWVD